MFVTNGGYNMLWLLIILSILVLVFIPFPLKISFTYSKKEKKLYIYSFKIEIEKGKKKTKKTKNKKNKFDIEKIKKIFAKLRKNKFKPRLKFYTEVDYGLDDAALTGISFGLLNCISPAVYAVLKSIFKVKIYKFDVKPDFKNQMFNFNLTSIIFLSFANIIYICFCILFS